MNVMSFLFDRGTIKQLRAECSRRLARIDALERENTTLHRLLDEARKQLAEEQYAHEQTERLRSNAFAAYDQQVAQNTEARHLIEVLQSQVDHLHEPAPGKVHNAQESWKQ